MYDTSRDVSRTLAPTSAGAQDARGMQRRLLPILLALAALPVALVGTASAGIPKPWTNCAAVNALYPHGVGKFGAHDKTSGTPVTNFTHSNWLYSLAMKYNRNLDRDHDGIACEKS
jgi:Excalibur calcium-binding domain